MGKHNLVDLIISIGFIKLQFYYMSLSQFTISEIHNSL